MDHPPRRRSTLPRWPRSWLLSIPDSPSEWGRSRTVIGPGISWFPERKADVAYNATGWTDFSVGIMGAAATLVGLLFVAVSINLTHILALKGLPARAAQTLLFLATPLFAALFTLVPGQSRGALAGEILLLTAVTGSVHVAFTTGTGKPARDAKWLLNRVAPAGAITICLAVAGVTLVVQAGGGLYWLVPSAVLAFVFGITNAWVLLVEILR
jgi:hypothetical protein